VASARDQCVDRVTNQSSSSGRQLSHGLHQRPRVGRLPHVSTVSGVRVDGLSQLDPAGEEAHSRVHATIAATHEAGAATDPVPARLVGRGATTAALSAVATASAGARLTARPGTASSRPGCRTAGAAGRAAGSPASAVTSTTFRRRAPCPPGRPARRGPAVARGPAACSHGAAAPTRRSAARATGAAGPRSRTIGRASKEHAAQQYTQRKTPARLHSWISPLAVITNPTLGPPPKTGVDLLQSEAQLAPTAGASAVTAQSRSRFRIAGGGQQTLDHERGPQPAPRSAGPALASLRNLRDLPPLATLRAPAVPRRPRPPPLQAAPDTLDLDFGFAVRRCRGRPSAVCTYPDRTCQPRGQARR
jgi:hypothetical protein